MTGSLLLLAAPPAPLADFHWDSFFTSLSSNVFISPAILVIVITVVAQTAGVMVAFPMALARVSKRRVVHWPVDLYLWIFRGTPLLLQILFMYDGLAEFLNNPPLLYPITRNAVVAGTLALTLNEAAYMTEIIRSGLEAIDPGQYDAARALGMTPWQVTRKIVIPQTMRISLPPTVNEYINMSKNVSLLGFISVNELLATGQHQYQATYRVFEVLAVVAIYYLAITSLLTFVQKAIERRFGERQDEVTTPGFAQRMFTGMGRDAGGVSGH